MAEEQDAAMPQAEAAEPAENGSGRVEADATAEAAAGPDATAAEPAGAQQAADEPRSGSPKHKERSSRRDKDRNHKSSRDDPDRKSRHKHRDGDKDRRKDEKKSSRKHGSRSRSRSRDRKSRRDEREKSRHRSRHRSSSRERRRSRRSRSKSPRPRSSSRRHRSPSPVRRRSRNKQSPSSGEEGVGGYVPRKRQEPPREGVWSLAAAGFSTSYMDPYGAMRSQQAQLTPEEIRRQMLEQQLKARQMVLQQQASSAVAAASKTQREVYIGNLVGGMVTEDALRQLFNNTMAAAFPEQMVSGLDAVVNVSMHSEGRYAFVELRTPEMASAALQLSGQVQLLGQPISVGRPSGYVDPSAAQAAAETAKKALEQFQRGEITLEEAAAAGSNSPAPGAAGAAASPATAGAAAASPAPAAAAASPAPAAAAPPPQTPTPFLAVTGMVTAEVLADDTEYEEVIKNQHDEFGQLGAAAKVACESSARLRIDSMPLFIIAQVIEDLQDECGKYGSVAKVVVPRPPDAANAKSAFGHGNYGKAFVQFADEAQAGKARDAVHGRLFAGITVQVDFISAQDFTVAAS